MDRLKYEFRLQPGADPSQIRLAYRGAQVKLRRDGGLEVSTPVGGFQDAAPIAYQEVGGHRVPVDVHYALGDEAAYGFRLGAYDPDLPLVIDPVVLIYCGFIGGSSSDFGFSIAVDASGDAYVTGWTSSDPATFPEMIGPDITFNGYEDAFVAKVNANGTALIYAGYIGGGNGDGGREIAVDFLGNAYIIGYTASDQATFPVMVGPDLTYNGGAYDTFVAKVNASGTALLYAGYIGGSGADSDRSIESGGSITVDASGNAYVTGVTNSTEATFPETVGPDLTYNGGAFDAFVAKVNPGGTALSYAGYIGGNASDGGTDIAVDASGNAYVTGYTESDQATFPEMVGPDLTYNGVVDTFVIKVAANGATLAYAGYIGGSSRDIGYDIAVDTLGNAYVTGETASDQATFPVKIGPDLTYNGGLDVFVAKVNADGVALAYAGYLGGRFDDSGEGIALDASRNVYIAGYTASDQTTFPVKIGPDLTHNGAYDAYVAKVYADGTVLAYAGYIGGNDGDLGLGIALDALSNAYIIGFTSSDQATFPETVGPDLTHNGGYYDAFVAKVSVVNALYLPLIRK